MSNPRACVLNLLVAIGLLCLPPGNSAAADEKPDECGLASIYSTIGEKTAGGEDTRSENLTAAHRSLPFGTQVQVVNRENGHSSVVRITDRGPFIRGRIVDVSQAAARELDFSGLAKVCLRILKIHEVQPVGDTDLANSKKAPR
jgi:rare lipoprotein A